MSQTQPARIFISYSRKDGKDRADKLRRELAAQDFAIWQDLVALRGHADWWTQIETALRSKALEHFVLVVTPGALESPVVRQEIRLARQEGKTVSPVRGPGIGSLSALPRWLGNVYDLDVPERQRNFIRVLEEPGHTARVPMMAPELPDGFVRRPREFEALKRQLLNPQGDAVAITAALRGAGGYGKTTLAKALAHDPDIQDAYYDGVLWAELGEQGGGRLLEAIGDLVRLLTDAARDMATIDGARTALAEALGDRRILLVVDDVWRRPHLAPFLEGGRHTTRLVTTRFDAVLPDGAAREPVDAMQIDEALALIGQGLPDGQDRALGEMAADLGEWPQLLKLANGFLRKRVGKGMAVDRAIADLAHRFATRGLVALDRSGVRDYADRHESVAKVIGTSLELLEELREDGGARDRFAELGICPEDVDVPIGIVARLWADTGGLDRFETDDLLDALWDLSLLLSLDRQRDTLRLHDTTRHYLRHCAGDGLAGQHGALVAAIGGPDGAAALPEAERAYAYRYLPQHLDEAGDRQTLDALMLDAGWLKAKLAATGHPQSLVADYDQYARGRAQDLIGRTLRLANGICARDQRQLLPQLLGRLMAVREASLGPVQTSAAQHLDRPVLLPTYAALTPPGSETARLEGHSNAVLALAVLPDGRLASGSSDNTVRLWDPQSGAETARLEGHTGAVLALAVLPDGRLASGYRDKTVRLWDPKSGTETARLEGHAGWVTALAVLPDGRLASGSSDNTVRLWDPKSGAETARLAGHAGGVTALAVLPDGRLASGSFGKVRLWDPQSGVENALLEGHAGPVNALAVLPDGRLASGSYDKTVCLWDPKSGVETARLEGHAGQVLALVGLPDGRLASGSDDKTVRLWDLKSGVETARLEGHADAVSALAVLPDGRLASGPYDKTVRLWDLKSGVETARLAGHAGGVRALAVLPDGRLASGSNDTTVRLWDTKSGSETARLEGHASWVNALVVLPDGHLASGSWDNTVRLWDPKSGSETARLVGHAGWVEALAVLPDGRLASGSTHETVRLWNPKSGVETARLEGHAGSVNALAVLPDGRLASGSRDNTVRLWDPQNGAETARLEGHDRWVLSLAVLPDGRLASGARDNTVRLWDPKSEAEIHRLEGHAGAVWGLAVLPDGRLASGSSDKTVRLWDPVTGDELCRLEVDGAVLCLTVLPARDGQPLRLIAGDQFGRLHWLAVLD